MSTLAATASDPAHKIMITIRLDTDVIAWFKSQGPGYQTRMNDALRQVMIGHVSTLDTPSPEAPGKSSTMVLQFSTGTTAAA